MPQYRQVSPSHSIVVRLAIGTRHQRRSVRGTVREERADAVGDEEPAKKSRASLSHQPGKRDQGDGAEHG